jgi:uncharacterized protein DUF4440
MKRLLRGLLLLCFAIPVVAQEQAPDPLYQEIAKADAELFAAFNAHDVDKLGTYFDKGLEFFHDKGGLQSFEQVISGTRSVFEQNKDLRRELVPGSLEVHPIHDYGAIEIGAHKFCHTENAKLDCGVFKFVHVWQKQKDGWKITKVISYDH